MVTGSDHKRKVNLIYSTLVKMLMLWKVWVLSFSLELKKLRNSCSILKKNPTKHIFHWTKSMNTVYNCSIWKTADLTFLLHVVWMLTEKTTFTCEYRVALVALFDSLPVLPVICYTQIELNDKKNSLKPTEDAYYIVFKSVQLHSESVLQPCFSTFWCFLSGIPSYFFTKDCYRCSKLFVAGCQDINCAWKCNKTRVACCIGLFRHVSGQFLCLVWMDPEGKTP